MLYAKVTRSDAGYDCDKEKIKVLSLDTYYPVTNVSMGGSHTSIFIDGIPLAKLHALGRFDAVADGDDDV